MNAILIHKRKTAAFTQEEPVNHVTRLHSWLLKVIQLSVIQGKPVAALHTAVELMPTMLLKFQYKILKLALHKSHL